MKSKVLLIFSLVLIMQFSISVQGKTISQQEDLKIDQKELEEYVTQLFEEEMDSQHIPGAAIIITQGKEVLLSKGFGYSDVATKEKVSPESTVFRIGSVSKVFVADSVMQLTEKNKIDFDEDISSYLKTIEISNPFNNPITMHQLLTHTSGLDDQRIGDLSIDRKEIEPLSEFLESNLLPVVRQPGEVIQYNSYGIALAAAVIEDVTNQKYSMYVEENIFQPLGMMNTSMLPEVESLSRSYQYSDGQYKLYPSFGYFNIYPAGGVLSTASDMGKYMIAHLNDGEYNNVQILSKQSIKKIHNQQETFDPVLTGMGYTYWIREYNNYKLLEHGGYGLGYLTDLCLIPEYNLGIFVTINQGDNNFPEEAVRAIIDEFLPKKKSLINDKNIETETWLDIEDFIGYYRFLEMTQTTFDKCSVFPYGQDYRVKINQNGQMILEEKGYYFPDQKTYTLERIENMVFKNLEDNQTIVFRKSEDSPTIFMAESNTSHHGTYVQLKWYETPLFQLSLFIVCMTFFIIVMITFLIMKLYSIIRSKYKKISIKPYNKLIYISVLTSALNAGFIITSLYTFNGRLQYGVPIDVKALLMVPFISLSLIIVMLITWIKDIRTGMKYGIRNAYYLVSILISLAYIWFLNYWNLLGFRY
ncbi:serine hydrolase domain-containing protein [Vallitalea okinawensis]|uniref:serine hydrolase domain-containing protein n=1 Tax=Vallitalea okinawensis TaxID=2078660 RepID=UPI000CFB539B|nr:serine hydrolase domain-containing protein [Vallitalea okinawensis]